MIIDTDSQGLARRGRWLERIGCSRLLPVLLLVMLPLSGLAQPRLPGQLSAESESQPVVPEPGRLESGWWRYIADADDEQLQTRIDAVMRNVESAALSLRVADASGSAEIIDRIRANLGSLQRLRSQPPVEPHPPVRLQGEYSPDQLFDVIAERMAMQRAVEAQAIELQEREENLAREQQQLERAFANYLTLPTGSAERLLQGLEVIGARTSVAASEARLARLQAQQATSVAFVEDLQRQIDHARKNLVADPEQQEQLPQRIAAAEQEQLEALARIAVAESRGLQVELGSDRGRAEQTLLNQQKVGAEIDHALARAAEVLARAQQAWGSMRLDDDPPQGLNDELVDWRQVAAQVRQDADSWRASSAGVLLTPAAVTGRGDARDSGRLEDQAREQAQNNLRRLGDLAARAAQIDLMIALMSDELALRQGPLQRWWINTRLFLINRYDDALRLLNYRLFTIGDAPLTASAILRILLILLVAFWISKALRHALEQLGNTRAFMSVSSIYTLGRLLHYVIIISALFIGLGSIGLDFSNLALIAGALSVGIGFGLQSIVSNFVSGLILLFERSLKVGDYVELDNGLTGHVREINIRSTRINTNDNIDVLVPNSEFVSTRLTNWTLRESIARLHIPFGVAYGSDKDLVQAAALEAADAVEFTLKNMPGREPEVWLVGFGDSKLDFELLIWVSRQGVRRPARVKAAYLWELHTALSNYGIKIPFPQRDLHLRSGLEFLGGDDKSLSAAADNGQDSESGKDMNGEATGKGQKRSR